MTDSEIRAPAEMSAITRFACLFGGTILGVFSLGVIAGFAKASIERGAIGWKAIPVFVVIALMIAAAIWLVRKGLTRMTLAKSPKMREYQLVTLGTVAIGVCIGALMQGGISSSGGGFNGPLSPAVAAVLLALMPVTAWLFYRWHMTADEHEQAAYNFGGILSLYAYFFATFAWWVAWRGGLTGEPSALAILVLVLIVWSIGWAWRRFR
ncbi:MAG: hypothetical protein ACKOPO_06835 [Novosphingobium sp.]